VRLQRGDLITHHIPDDFIMDTEIVMCDIKHHGNLLPNDVWILLLNIFREIFCRFTNDFGIV
jgi:hypothetical protein